MICVMTYLTRPESDLTGLRNHCSGGATQQNVRNPIRSSNKIFVILQTPGEERAEWSLLAVKMKGASRGGEGGEDRDT